MSDAPALRKAGLAYRALRRYLRTQESYGVSMVALGIIFGFLAIVCVLNLIEFKRID
jgi:hypothetical protein